MVGDLHVQHYGRTGWAVEAEGDLSPVAIFDSKRVAVQAGEQLARAERVDLVIHDARGAVAKRITHRPR
jgi:hypothetical protein